MSLFIKAAVIGHPISHSKSPRIHNYWITHYGLAGSYEAIDLPPSELKEGLHRLIEAGYTGFNLTVPHKESVMALCDVVEPRAQAIGAVNTLWVNGGITGGKIHGTNTDVFGFLENIRQTVKKAVPEFSFAGKRALVLGAGGAARAIVRGLLDENVAQIFLVNRTRDKAGALAQDPHFAHPALQVVDWEDRHAALSGMDLLVNTTTLGMRGQPALDLDLSALPQHTVVNDIVYAPLYTPLLQHAQARGNVTVTGIGMLLHQARPAFQKWFGILPEVTSELEAFVLV